MSLLKIALEYAAGGAAVLPLHTPTAGGCSCRRRGCEHAGKHPRTLRGKDDATSDPATIERWWSMWPQANIGIRPASGLIVLDIDLRHRGDEQLAAMQERYGRLPATRTARTGSGGEHRWFSCPGEVRGVLAPGIDIKTSRGYVCAPPSKHATGGRYEWTNTGPIAPAPDCLRRLLAPPPLRVPRAQGPVSPAVVAGLVRVVAEAQPGHRNSALYWAAARAVEKGVDVNLLIEAALAVGLSRAEAERTVASAAKAPPRTGGAG